MSVIIMIMITMYDYEYDYHNDHDYEYGYVHNYDYMVPCSIHELMAVVSLLDYLMDIDILSIAERFQGERSSVALLL